MKKTILFFTLLTLVSSAFAAETMINLKFTGQTQSKETTKDERLEEMMKRNHDYFFFPEEALEIGLIDCIDVDGFDVNIFAEKVYGLKKEEVEEIEESDSVEIYPDEEDIPDLFPLNVE